MKLRSIKFQKMKTADIALTELADLIELIGAVGPEKFKIMQYRNAAEIIAELQLNTKKMSKEELMQIDNIGNSIFDKIIEFHKTGKIAKAENLKKLIPITILEFTKLRKVGPATAKQIWNEYNVTTLKQLIKLADSGKVSDKLKESIEFYKTSIERISLSLALDITSPIFEALQALPEVFKISYGGSISRKKETIHDADILTLVTDQSKVIEIFTKFADEIESSGGIKSVIWVKKFKIELTIITNPLEWGAALFHITGPKNYNISNRVLAESKGLFLNDKGLWSGNIQVDDGTEIDICEKLEIPWLNPNLRK